jgi:predicted RNA binding protein YcfA (HicA-like mRNA interferase family)
MGFEKALRKLLAKPVEMKIREVVIILSRFGYKLTRISGSHFQFKKENRPLLTVACHNKTVSKLYVKDICNIITKELSIKIYEKEY